MLVTMETYTEEALADHMTMCLTSAIWHNSMVTNLANSSLISTETITYLLRKMQIEGFNAAQAMDLYDSHVSQKVFPGKRHLRLVHSVK